MYTIDGNYTLGDTESAIRAKEAAGRELKTLRKRGATPPTNEADFKNLPAGQKPVTIHLILGDVPDGENEVWSGEIYVEGVVQSAKAYRK